MPPEITNSFHHPPFMSNRDTHISASQLPQVMIYEIEQQSSSLFQELRRPGASDNDVTTRILQILQGPGPARASSVLMLGILAVKRPSKSPLLSVMCLLVRFS